MSIYPWINFAVLFLGLAIVLNKALGTHFKRQRDDLESKMKAASQEHDRMRAEFDETRAMMSSLESRISDLKFNASREVQLEAKKLEFETERFIEKMVSDGDLRMRAEIIEMKVGLEKDLLEQAITSARKTLERDLKSKDAEWTGTMLQGEAGANEGRKTYAS